MAALGGFFQHYKIREVNESRRSLAEPYYLGSITVPKIVHWGVIEFDDSNWSREGVYVSDNTYYDNIMSAYWSKNEFHIYVAPL